MTTLHCKPIIIIGAPRSGTNILRNVLSALPGFCTWPCDEIPYIWKYGNRGYPHDELSPDVVTPAIRTFIRKQFNRQVETKAEYLIEKTCANSLRVNYVANILPEAVFIFIIRNGIDASASAMKRWKSGFSLRYSLAKSRYVPTADIPFHTWQLVQSRLRQIISRDNQLPSWGPAFIGMNELASNANLPALAATQWLRCVENSQQQLSSLARNRVHKIKYEDFVTNPATHLHQILEFLDCKHNEVQITQAVTSVHAASIGKAATDLSKNDLAIVKNIVWKELIRQEYNQS